MTLPHDFKFNAMYRGVNAMGYSWGTSDGFRDCCIRTGHLSYWHNVIDKDSELDYERLLKNPILILRGYEPQYYGIVKRLSEDGAFMASIETETQFNMDVGVQPMFEESKEVSQLFKIIFCPSIVDMNHWPGVKTLPYKFMADTCVFHDCFEPISEKIAFVGHLTSDRRELLVSIPDLQIDVAPPQKTSLMTAWSLAETMCKYRFLLAPAGRSVRIMSGRVGEIMACGRICMAFINDTIMAEQDMSHLHDMENIVLWRTVDELMEKYKILSSRPDQCRTIQKNARQCALEHYSQDMWIRKMVEAMCEEAKK